MMPRDRTNAFLCGHMFCDGVPLAAAGEVEHGDLRLAVFDRRAAIEREIVRDSRPAPSAAAARLAARCSPSERPSSMRNCSSDTNSLGQSAGRLCPRSLTNSMHGSASSLLTNWRNRRRFSGSRTTAAHSHWYVSTRCCDHRFQLGGDAELVVDDDVADVIDAAFELLAARRSFASAGRPS